MKLSGVGKGGISCLFIGSVISLIASIVILLIGLAGYSFLNVISSKILTIFAIISMVFPLLVIIVGSLAMIKKSNGLKIACGVLGLISIIFVWAAFCIPAILALVGGILTLCGKFEGRSEFKDSPSQNKKLASEVSIASHLELNSSPQNLKIEELQQ